MEDGWLTPHFTAFHRAPGQFRRRLAKFRPEAIAGFEERVSLELVRAYFGALEPVTLDRLERPLGGRAGA